MKVSEGLSRDLLRLLFWYPLRWTILLVPIRTAVRLLRLLGDIHCFFAKGKSALLHENIGRLGLPATKSQTIIREYFRNHYIDQLFILIFPKMGQREVEKMVKIRGVEILNRCLAKGKGVVLVHGHFGPAHLPLVALARLGYNMKQIGNPSHEGLSWVGRNIAYRLRMHYEARMPAEIIKAGGFPRPAFNWLRKNNIIMITGDGSGTTREFGRQKQLALFGYPVRFPLGPYRLAAKTGAALLPLFVVPGQDKLFEIIIEDELTIPEQGEKKNIEPAGCFAARLENYISKYPGYMHFLDRFHPGGLIADGQFDDS